MPTPEDTGQEKKKKSLLQKYEVPISHLDFSYINKCRNITELEHIIKILRSNEEGCYPELLKCAEERLCFFNPENKLLRVVEPILTRNQLDPEEWKIVEDDILNWKDEVEDVENRLSRSKVTSGSGDIYPEVRRPVGKLNGSVDEKGDKKDPPKRISATDYKKWDMYDADTEILKLDLEEEKKEEQRLKQQEEKKKTEPAPELSLEEQELQLIAGTADALSEEERNILAVKEKNLGNEFYQGNRWKEAIRHYTRSIYLNPTAVAYNNRAATYLKQCRFTKALDDLNIVISKEPENVKGRFRRAIALQHKNEFEKALEDILVVLKYQPHHVLARHIADELRENCADLPRKLRVRMADPENPSRVVIKEVTEEELKTVYKDLDYVEVNERNLPRIMCNCNGKYTNDPCLRTNDPIRFQHLRERYVEKYNKTTTQKAVVSPRQEPESNSLSSSKRVKPMSVSVAEESASTCSTGKRNKPLVETANPSQGSGALFGGAKKLEIIEMEKIVEEDHSPNKQQIVSLNTNGSPSPTTCLISDMRGKQKKTYFGAFSEEDDSNSLKESNDSSADSNSHSKEEMCPGVDLKEYGSSRFDVSDAVPGAIDGGFGPCSFMSDSSMVVPHLPGTINTWNSIHHHNRMVMDNFKTSPQSPLSNSSANEFSSDIDSDDLFPDDENSTDQIIDMNQVERVIDNDVDTISKDFFPHDNLIKCECGEGYKLKPSQFELKWLSFENNVNSVNERGKLIRLVCPHQLSSVIGNTLNESFLAGFITCLNYHFDVETERDKILSYLQAISCVQRFSIITKFLSSKAKTVAEELLKKLHPMSNTIEEAFS